MMQPTKPKLRKQMTRKIPVLIASSFALAIAVWTSGLMPARINGLASVEASPLRPLYPEECDQIVLMRRAGLTNDHSRVPLVISILDAPSHPHPLVVRTALHTLAQLGATEALPAFDVVAQSKLVEPGYLEAMRQRLLAESQAASAPAGTKRAETKIALFYKGLSLTPSQVRTANLNTNARMAGVATPTEVLATREVADMAYHGNHTDYKSLDGVTQISNTSDIPSVLKLRLAPLSRTLRVQTLIDDLAQSKVLSVKQDYEMQLADDEGTLASQAAAAKLQDMDKNRGQYPREGFEAIFNVLSGAGDATQATLVEHYTHDSNGYIAYFAKNTYPEVRAGHHGMLVPDY